ncbi:hypothetical protein Ancab_030140 [Ancistrocladus abbreviatus]
MDSGDQWNKRLSAYSRRFQSRSEDFLGGDYVLEVEGDYICPFCAGEFDIVGLFCHFDEEHQVEVKNGVQHKRRLCRGRPTSLFSILRKELWNVNQQSLSGISSQVLAASNPDPDPLLSSFVYSSTVVEQLGDGKPCSSTDESSTMKTSEENNGESAKHPQFSVQEQEEKARKCEFAQGLLLSTIIDDVF